MGDGMGTKEKIPPVGGIFSDQRDELLHLAAEVGTGLELHYLLGSDLDLFAGLWVAAFTGSTLRNAESAEAYEGNTVTFAQSFGGACNKCVKGTLCVCLRKLCISCDGLDQFCFVHSHFVSGWFVG